MDIGHAAPAPRELVVEVRGEAESLDAAVDHFSSIGRPLATLLAFCANVAVGRIEAHIVYDATEGTDRREFLEVFLPDEQGMLTEGRVVKVAEFNEIIDAFLKVTNPRRLVQSLHQYELALRYWYFGGEYLALAHLYMGR